MTNSQNLPASIDDTNNLIDSSNKDSIEDIREEAFIKCLSVYPTIREAAIAAGYSEQTAKSTIYTKLHSEPFQNKLRAFYKGYAARYLPFITRLEGKALQAIDEDIDKLPKFQHTLKEIKQAAGVLAHDQQPSINLVKIDNIQVLMQDMQSNKEVIDVSDKSE